MPPFLATSRKRRPSYQSSETHCSLQARSVSSMTLNSVQSPEDEVAAASDRGVDVPVPCSSKSPPRLLNSQPANAGPNGGGMTSSSVVSNVTLEQCVSDGKGIQVVERWMPSHIPVVLAHNCCKRQLQAEERRNGRCGRCVCRPSRRWNLQAEERQSMFLDGELKNVAWADSLAINCHERQQTLVFLVAAAPARQSRAEPVP